MSSYESLNSRLTELTGQLNQKDRDLDQQLEEIIEADLDDLDQEIETTKKDLHEGLRQRVETVKKRIKDRKDGLRQRVEAAKKGPKDRATKEAEDALKKMQEDISQGDLESAYIERWIASQWLRASK
jgi:ABC-type transporter Mla subunit MlaD